MRQFICDKCHGNVRDDKFNRPREIKYPSVDNLYVPEATYVTYVRFHIKDIIGHLCDKCSIEFADLCDEFFNGRKMERPKGEPIATATSVME